jgi:hypothetical protein
MISDRNNIEIDYCPDCRGVWLDRGELDKIIERSDRHDSQIAAPNQSQPSRDHHQQTYDKPNYYDKHYKKKRKESFLGDMFDF